MSQLAPVQGWSELLIALPEFDLTDAHVSDHDEFVADVKLPRDVQACLTATNRVPASAAIPSCTTGSVSDEKESATSKSSINVFAS